MLLNRNHTENTISLTTFEVEILIWKVHALANLSCHYKSWLKLPLGSRGKLKLNDGGSPNWNFQYKFCLTIRWHFRRAQIFMKYYYYKNNVNSMVILKIWYGKRRDVLPELTSVKERANRFLFYYFGYDIRIFEKWWIGPFLSAPENLINDPPAWNTKISTHIYMRISWVLTSMNEKFIILL